MRINRIFLDEVNSTNAFANELVAKSTPIEGTVISTHHQTQGRGQIGRNWDSGKAENLSFSLILYPKHVKPQDQFQLNMLISVSLAKVLQELLEQTIYLKWPNDIVIMDKKIAGILIQCVLAQKSIQSAVCGIGLNVLQDNFEEKSYKATSMKIADPTLNYNLDELENMICEEILRNYYAHKQGQLNHLKHSYLQKLYKRGDTVAFEDLSTDQIFEAEIIGIDHIGRLSLHVQGKVKHFQLGEIKMKY